MNLLHFVRKVMSVALQFERGASADDKRSMEKRLNRDDDLLPSQRAARAAIDAARRLFEPVPADIMIEELAGVALPPEPCRIDEHSFGQLPFKSV